jgi:L-ectoine synthase
MIVRSLADVVGTERDVSWGNGRSRRFLIAADRMGYSITDTIVDAGTESPLEYRRHFEACYCVEGEGEVEAGGVVYPLAPGTLYALDAHDRHVLRARTTMRLVCVFRPALEGNETHDLSSGRPSTY